MFGSDKSLVADEKGRTLESGRLLWGVGDAAAFLKTTVGGIFKLVERRTIPHIRLGRRLLFDPRALQAWIAKHHVPPEPAFAKTH